LKPANRVRFRDAAMFLGEVQSDFFASVRDFVREELGFPILINGSGWHGVGWLGQMDEYTNGRDMDYIARHGYWDHPQHGRGPNACFRHRQMLSTLPHDSLIEYFASRRPSHIPFTLTEWNQCAPNDQLIEAVPIMACYGGLQNWGMLLHYRMAFPDWLLSDDIAFSPESPAMLFQYPVAAFAFLHSCIKPGDVVWRNAIPDVFDIARIKEQETEYMSKRDHHAGYGSAGEHALVGRCENVYDDDESSQADITPYRSADGQSIRSITEELRWRGLGGLEHRRTGKDAPRDLRGRRRHERCLRPVL
jgi:hypothetical protein